ncbi:MAG: response regulator transcription factor [Ruminococcus sp.]|nr:response regulator transcription factor [Ruminococcus sp.]
MIYLLEDDDSIRNFVVYALNNSGFETVGFESPAAFREAMHKELPELILLDIMLPEEDGISILKKLRAVPETCKLPIIMLTAKASEYDKVIGLDNGADDYIAKPFGTMELISRIRALLRRTSSASKNTEEFKIGGLYVCPSKHIVRADGQDVVLTYKEFEILTLLMKNEGTVFSRDMLLQKVWGYDYFGESRTVDVHIRTLRSKLGECGELIQTVRGVGYKIGEGSK